MMVYDFDSALGFVIVMKEKHIEILSSELYPILRFQRPSMLC